MRIVLDWLRIFTKRREDYSIMGDLNNMPIEKRRLIHSLIFPVLFLLICWIVKIYELVMGVSFVSLGILPRSLEGLPGILFAPFIHGDMNHIYANSVTFIILAWGFFYFYREIALKVFLYILFFGNALLWLGGREAWHIGCSGIIYGLGAFLFISGAIRRNMAMSAIALVVVFLYGSMFWHLFPVKINDPVSWEGHLMGALVGGLLAIHYRKTGPQADTWEWPDEEDEELEVPEENTEFDETRNV